MYGWLLAEPRRHSPCSKVRKTLGLLAGVRSGTFRAQKKAMVVISDGGDNHSRYSESEIKSLLEEVDVEVYAIGMFDRFAKRLEEKRGPLQFDEITSVTGGRVFSVHDSVELARAVAQISHELRNQYVLGYYPKNRVRDGKWRRLKIRLTKSASQEKFRLYAKKGLLRTWGIGNAGRDEPLRCGKGGA
jgi:Ca-activated chloride channel family protein